MGLFPILICGSGNSRNNYTQRKFTIPPPGPFGGNLSIFIFTLGSLFEEWELHHNVWSRTNQDLDLIVYRGSSLKFWRDPEVDYIVNYSRNAPFKISELSHAAGQPFAMLMSRHRIIIPSLKTKPHGKKYKRLFLKPPRMLTQKFYFQSDLCNVGLFLITASACRLQDPWMNNKTTSPCVSFYALKPTAYNKMSTVPNKDKHTDPYKNKNLDQWLYNPYFQPWWPKVANKESNKESWKWENLKANIDKVKTQIQKWQSEDNNSFIEEAKWIGYKPSNATEQRFHHAFGYYSPVLLSPDKLLPETDTPYMTIRYNPHNDKGIGNWLALKSITSEDNTLDNTCKMVLKDYQLWILAYGYSDGAEKLFSGWSVLNNYRLICRCPYTSPPLAYPQATDYNKGFVVYGHSFATGNMPGGERDIPIAHLNKWYPRLQMQQEVLEYLSDCGPLMPRDSLSPGWQATMGYKCKFTLGGTLPPPQDPVDPCKQPKRQLPDPGAVLVPVQVVDPAVLDPARLSHPWEWRRGYLTRGGLKRVLADHPTDQSLYAGPQFPPKRPKSDVPIQEGEGDSSSPEAVLQSLLREQEGSETEDPREETEPPRPLEQQLRVELERQRVQQGKLQQGLQLMLQQLLRTQQGVHLHPHLR